MGSYWTRFSQWQNYLHYLLNGLFLVIELDIIGVNVSTTFHFLMFIWTILSLTVLILINDSIIHFILGYLLPKKYRWRD